VFDMWGQAVIYKVRVRIRLLELLACHFLGRELVIHGIRSRSAALIRRLKTLLTDLL
jgi:hypothetical protein